MPRIRFLDNLPTPSLTIHMTGGGVCVCVRTTSPVHDLSIYPNARSTACERSGYCRPRRSRGSEGSSRGWRSTSTGRPMRSACQTSGASGLDGYFEGLTVGALRHPSRPIQGTSTSVSCWPRR